MIFLFCIGACLGSFIGVVIDRIPQELNCLWGRSYCFKCHHQLTFFDMIPILGWFFCRGRCRYCHQPISPFYPIIETLSGVMILLVYSLYGWSFSFVYVYLLGLLLLCMSVIDYRTLSVYHIHLFLLLIFAGLAFYFDEQSLMERIEGMLSMSVLMMVMNCIKTSFGHGDIVMAMCFGWILGIDAWLLAIFIATLTGSLYSIMMILLKKKDRYDFIPFVPFMSLGVMMVLMWI